MRRATPCTTQTLPTGTIRKLWPTETAKFRDHLLRLDRQSRRMRFAHGVSDRFVEDYAARMADMGGIVYGYFEGEDVRAAAELKKLGDTWGREAEAAFSVEQPLQEHGIGTVLMGRVIRAARNRGVQHLCISCLAENSKMQAIARHFEAELRFEYGEVVGEIVPRGSKLLFAARGGRRRSLRLHDGGSRSAQSRRQSGVTRAPKRTSFRARCVACVRCVDFCEMRTLEYAVDDAARSKHDKNDDFSQHTPLNARVLAFHLQFHVNKMIELAHDFFSSSDSN